MSGYVPRHAKHARPDELPVILRGLADLITVISNDTEEN